MMRNRKPIDATRRAMPPPSLGTLRAWFIQGRSIHALRLTMARTVRFRMRAIDSLASVRHRPLLAGFDRLSNSSSKS